MRMRMNMCIHAYTQSHARVGRNRTRLCQKKSLAYPSQSQYQSRSHTSEMQSSNHRDKKYCMKIHKACSFRCALNKLLRKTRMRIRAHNDTHSHVHICGGAKRDGGGSGLESCGKEHAEGAQKSHNCTRKRGGWVGYVCPPPFIKEHHGCMPLCRQANT